MSEDYKAIKIKLGRLPICEDQSTNTTETAHLRIIIRGVFTNFEILEKFLGSTPMQSTIIDKYILTAKVQCTSIMGFDFKFL